MTPETEAVIDRLARVSRRRSMDGWFSEAERSEIHGAAHNEKVGAGMIVLRIMRAKREHERGSYA